MLRTSSPTYAVHHVIPRKGKSQKRDEESEEEGCLTARQEGEGDSVASQGCISRKVGHDHGVSVST